jgi:hypothetical protein
MVAVSQVGHWLTDQESDGWLIVGALTRSSQTSSPPPQEVACLTEGVRFSASFLDGPLLARDESLATPVGQAFDAFFVRGPGREANRHYLSSEGFSVVSESLVLGYENGLPLLIFHPTDVAIASFPPCVLTMAVGEAVAARWVLAEPADSDTASLQIAVAAERCVTNSGTDPLTELWGLSLIEDSERVEVTVWTRVRASSDGACIRTRLVLSEEVGLDAPLGSRSLLDGGFRPLIVIDR